MAGYCTAASVTLIPWFKQPREKNKRLDATVWGLCFWSGMTMFPRDRLKCIIRKWAVETIYRCSREWELLQASLKEEGCWDENGIVTQPPTEECFVQVLSCCGRQITWREWLGGESAAGPPDNRAADNRAVFAGQPANTPLVFKLLQMFLSSASESALLSLVEWDPGQNKPNAFRLGHIPFKPWKDKWIKQPGVIARRGQSYMLPCSCRELQEDRVEILVNTRRVDRVRTCDMSCQEARTSFGLQMVLQWCHGTQS